MADNNVASQSDEPPRKVGRTESSISAAATNLDVPPPCRSLFISGLPFSDDTESQKVLEEKLTALFEPYGAVLRVTVLSKGKRLQGKAFVDFADDGPAQRVLECLASASAEQQPLFLLDGKTPLTIEAKSPVETTPLHRDAPHGAGSRQEEAPPEARKGVTAYVFAKGLSTKHQLFKELLSVCIPDEAECEARNLGIGAVVFVETSKKPYFLVELRPLKGRRSQAAAQSEEDDFAQRVALWIQCVDGATFRGQPVTAKASVQTVADYKEKLSLREAKATPATTMQSMPTLVPRSVRLAAKPKGASPPASPETARKVKAFLFDFDGTLVDTMAGFADIAGEIIHAYHGDISFSEARRRYLETSGLPFFQQLEIILPGDPTNPEKAKRFEEEKKRGFFRASFSGDVHNTVRALRGQGYIVGVCSNNFQQLIDEFVAREELAFDVVLGYRDGFEKGRDHFAYVMKRFGLMPEEIIFIGDSLKDGEKARANGILFRGLCGTFTEADFKAADAQCVTIQSVRELLRDAGR